MKYLACVLYLGFCCMNPPDTYAQNSGVSLIPLPAYQLQAGDSVQILYRLTPEYNQTVSVQPDGSVTLQLLGSVPVRGLTMVQARELIQQAASKRLRNPELALELKDFERPHFTVLGEVGTPGAMNYEVLSVFRMGWPWRVASRYLHGTQTS